jgi:hypothetical protein
MRPTPDGTLADPTQIIADLQRANTELQRKLDESNAERDEALEQQTATAEVLGVINASPGDRSPVFDAMLEKATRVCDAVYAVLWTYYLPNTCRRTTTAAERPRLDVWRETPRRPRSKSTCAIWRRTSTASPKASMRSFRVTI